MHVTSTPSPCLSSAERNFDVGNRELLAIRLALVNGDTGSRDSLSGRSSKFGACPFR